MSSPLPKEATCNVSYTRSYVFLLNETENQELCLLTEKLLSHLFEKPITQFSGRFSPSVSVEISSNGTSIPHSTPMVECGVRLTPLGPEQPDWQAELPSMGREPTYRTNLHEYAQSLYQILDQCSFMPITAKLRLVLLLRKPDAGILSSYFKILEETYTVRTQPGCLISLSPESPTNSGTLPSVSSTR